MSSKRSRVLLVAPHDGHSGHYVARAFEALGWDVSPFDYRIVAAVEGVPAMNDALMQRAALADLVLVLKGELVSPLTLESMRSVGLVVAVWNFDPRDGQEAWVLERARAASHYFTIAKGLVASYRAQGINAHWLLEAADPDLHRPDVEAQRVAPTQPTASFIGTIQDVPGRAEWLLDVATCFPDQVRLWGSFVPPNLAPWHHGRAAGDAGFNHVVGLTTVNLGRDRNPEVERSYGARLFRTLAAGGYLVTNDTLGIYEDWDGCLNIYHDTESCIRLVEWGLAHPERVQAIAERGRQRVLERHTWRHRVVELLDVVGLAP